VADGYLDRPQLVVLLADEHAGGVAMTGPKALARLQKFMAAVGVPPDAAEIRINLGVSPRVVWTPAGVVDH
jgi:hypothetical protein